MSSSLCKQLKVIEFASVLAGPLVGRFFAEHGAEVIKIENKRTKGDVTRSWRTKSEPIEPSVSAYYASANYGKQSILLDLKTAEDLEIALDLCKDADIVLSNFKEGSAAKMGLDFDKIKAINPNIIYGQILGYAHAPNKPAFDVLLQAETGYLAMTGFRNQKYAKIPIAMIDQMAAHQLIEGILIALWSRERNKACKIEVDLYQSALSALINQASAYLMNGDIPQAIGSEHPSIAPYGKVFYSKDNLPLVLAVGTQRQFESLAAILSIKSQVSTMNTNEARVQQKEKLHHILADAIAQFNRQDLLEKLDQHKIPSAAVKNLKEVFEDPNARKTIMQEVMEGRTSKSIKLSNFYISG